MECRVRAWQRKRKEVSSLRAESFILLYDIVESKGMVVHHDAREVIWQSNFEHMRRVGPFPQCTCDECTFNDVMDAMDPMRKVRAKG